MKICLWFLCLVSLIILIGSGDVITTQAQAGTEPELPRAYVNTTYTAPTGAVITLPTGGNLQTALNSANPGDVIMVKSGATFTGNFTLPNKPGSGWITVRTSSPDSALPPVGTRVLPSYAPAMAKLVTPNTQPVIKTAQGAHHFRFIGIEFGVASTVTTNYGIVSFGNGDESLTSQMPHDLILDRCYLHGNATGDVSRAVALNCANSAVIDSYISAIHGAGFDTQAIAAWNSPGPLKIVNNYLEGAGENVLFGGADPRMFELVVSDLEIRRNHCAKPLSWNPSDPSYLGQHWTVKNLFELKNAQRVLVEGNLFENNWTDAQNGTAILFTPRNQDGTAPWSVVQDVTFRRNIVRNVGGAMTVLGTDDERPSQQTKRILIADNLFERVGGSGLNGNGHMLTVLNGVAGVKFDHNTVFKSWNALTTEGAQTTGFVYSNNILSAGDYGFFGGGVGEGAACLQTYFPSGALTKNVFTGRESYMYPAINYFPATISAVGFVDLAGGNCRLAASSPYKNAGTDGKDLGADIDAIEAAMAGAGGTPTPNQPPQVSVSASPMSGFAPLVDNFSCNASDPDGQVVAFSWNFGDGQTSTSPSMSHTYQSAGTYTASLTVTDNRGATATASVVINVSNPAPPPPPPPPPSTSADIVMYALEGRLKGGNWKLVADQTAAGGARVRNPDSGAQRINTAAANPKSYYEISFFAESGKAYRLWMRGKADNNSPFNDSAFVQFSGSVNANGSPIYRIGTTSATEYNLEDYMDSGVSGWGWQDNGWGIGVMGPVIYFQSTGMQTLRLQQREDGLSVDQIVLSPQRYMLLSPGALKNDTIIIPR
jgi:PKD repeat protein